MIDSCEKLTLDLRGSGISQVVHTRQGDTGRLLRIHLAEGGKPYRIEEDCYALCPLLEIV